MVETLIIAALTMFAMGYFIGAWRTTRQLRDTIEALRAKNTELEQRLQQFRRLNGR